MPPGHHAAPPSASASGPSEYTRVMQGLSVPPAMPTPASSRAQTPAPGAGPSGPAPTQNYVPIAIVASVVVILVVAIVLFFALK